ncbi:Kinase, CMGC SRPK [Spironucleus salmonicida]|uniref:non-specific serine/threonine protein kinase n=1 Tax=Spironucleus salmonicida TaxID=348837 RepID=V6LDE0_9EUKA|nr:Kinase, CMGC SRPK [Spironucleus salmonicida]|eukprot:EST41676.1 Kinase, CMGC SRPK [Spironucleus salmonicida]
MPSYQNLSVHHQIDESTDRYDDNGYCWLQLFETEFKSDKSTYIPLRKIANGRFSTVYLSKDITFNRYVALKINISELDQQISKDEVDILKQIQDKCQQVKLEDNGGIVQLLDNFVYSKKEIADVFDDDCEETEKFYYCMVFELLGHSVYRLMTRYSPKVNYNKSIPLPIVKAISYNLLKSVHYLHNIANIIHTDLKPENLAMVYYLPLLNDTDYKLENILYGAQSQHIFDAKLSTPATTININDFDLLDKQNQSQICNYLHLRAQRQGIYQWEVIRNTIMDNTNFKKKFVKFIQKYGQAEVSTEQQCYCIDGMNIFNLPNLIKTSEEIFRAQILPKNFQQDYDQEIKIEQNCVNLFSTKQVFDSIVKGETVENFNLYQQLKLVESKYLKQNLKQLISSNGITYQLSNIIDNNLQQILHQSCVERIIYDSYSTKTLVKIARSGFHSRLQLYQSVAQKEKQISNQPINPLLKQKELDLPKNITPDEIKCYGLTTSGQQIYPTMISYYSKQQLIPFCLEMFKIKIIDLGNACYTDYRFSKTIQTPNYRAPEIIIGHEAYGPEVDDFSVGCIVFELITGNVLFRPRQDGKQDPSHHLKQIVQISGDQGLDWLLENCQNENLIEISLETQQKQFKFTKNLEFRAISTILVVDYGFDQGEAEDIEKFIKPFLHLNPNMRKRCKDMLDSQWLKDLGAGDYLVGYGGRQ